MHFRKLFMTAVSAADTRGVVIFVKHDSKRWKPDGDSAGRMHL